MENTLRFSECIRQLLATLNISGSKLAKAINIDPSLVNKWINEKRIPPVNSHYIDEIADYLSKNIIIPTQKRELREIARYAGFLYGEEEKDPYNFIKGLLSKSYDCSLNHNKNKTFKNWKYTDKNPVIYQFSNNTITNNLKGNPAISKHNDKYIISEDTVIEGKTSITYNGIIIRTRSQIVQTANNLLKAAANTRPVNEQPILLAFSSYVYSSHFNRESLCLLRNAIDKVLERGWQVICLICVNEDTRSIKEIIEGSRIHLMHGTYHPYYFKGTNSYLLANDTMVVPGYGAMMCFSTEPNNLIDSSFLFNNPEIIKILSKNFNRVLSASSPLIQTFPSHRSIGFQAAITDFDAKPGNRYVYSNGPGRITIPMNMYRKYIEKENKPNTDFCEKISYHQQELDAFYTHIHNYCYKEIYTKESIERLVNNRTYFPDQYLIGADETVSCQDIIEQLSYIIVMLENYNNYELGLINNNQSDQIPWTMMTIKENTSASFTALGNITMENIGQSWDESNFITTEKIVIQTFTNYFNELWEKIPQRNRDKKEVILWLKTQISKLL